MLREGVRTTVMVTGVIFASSELMMIEMASASASASASEIDCMRLNQYKILYS